MTSKRGGRGRAEDLEMVALVVVLLLASFSALSVSASLPAACFVVASLDAASIVASFFDYVQGHHVQGHHVQGHHVQDHIHPEIAVAALRCVRGQVVRNHQRNHPRDN